MSRSITARDRWRFLTPLLLLLLAPSASRAQAPIELTVTPNMVKGSAGAPVTIIEFSDYQ
jgi:protein-disulfide isomerase